MRLGDRIRRLEESGRLDPPPLGGGNTAGRWSALAELARHDVSEARIAEAHVDALQILAEADRARPAGCLYGVWASDHPRWRVTATAGADGDLVLHGSKAFCTGTGIVDRALVTITVDDDSTGHEVSGRSCNEGTHGEPDDGPGDGPHLLVDVSLSALAAERIDTSGWANTALADTATAVVDLTGLVVARSEVVGGHRWYLDRHGFWDGAIGPAACWAGAALGLVDHARLHPPNDPHGRAHLGAMSAVAWSLTAALDQAGREIDADTARFASIGESTDRSAGRRATAARARALTVRHLVDAGCAEIQDRFARALGPRPLVADAGVIERDHALSLYRRQCHAERDLEALGELLTAPRHRPEAIEWTDPSPEPSPDNEGEQHR